MGFPEQQSASVAPTYTLVTVTLLHSHVTRSARVWRVFKEAYNEALNTSTCYSHFTVALIHAWQRARHKCVHRNRATRELSLHKRAAELLSTGCDGWEIIIKKETVCYTGKLRVRLRVTQSVRTSRLVRNFSSPLNFSPGGKPSGLRGRRTFLRAVPEEEI